MAVLSIDIRGLDSALKSIGDKVKNYPQEIQEEINVWALETTKEAKQLAPKDTGHLAGAIHPQFGKLEAAVTVAVDYAAYQEFGTRGFAASYVPGLPEDWQVFAAQFKGSNTAKQILAKGCPPHPYLFPAAQNNNKKLVDRLKNLFK